MFNIDINCVNSCLVDNNTVFFTITNNGYIDFTKNMLKSLQPFSIDKKLLIVCLDEETNTYFKSNGYMTYFINLNLCQMAKFGEEIFSHFCYLKLLLIYNFLDMNINVFYTDGDIFYLKNPFDELRIIENVNGDLWIQNDTVFENNFENVCAGFMYIRSNELTKKYFNINYPEFINIYKECMKHNNDQTYLNQFVIPYLNVHLFSLKKFPNGKYFYHFGNTIKDEMVMVHFNWFIGHEKKEKMIKYGMWILT